MLLEKIMCISINLTTEEIKVVERYAIKYNMSLEEAFNC